MTDSRKLKELSRQQLYVLIWSKSIAEVAADFDVTETTVKNHCNNRRVPRPTQRYWKRLAAGMKPRRKPLPPTAREIFEVEAQKRIPKSLALPKPDTPLHALAAEMLVALNKAKPSSHHLIHFKDVQFPKVIVSKDQVDRAARSFHVIYRALESLGVEFRKFPGQHDPGYFRWGQDRLFLEIEKALLDQSGNEQTNYWWRS